MKEIVSSNTWAKRTVKKGPKAGSFAGGGEGEEHEPGKRKKAQVLLERGACTGNWGPVDVCKRSEGHCAGQNGWETDVVEEPTPGAIKTGHSSEEQYGFGGEGGQGKGPQIEQEQERGQER